MQPRNLLNLAMLAALVALGLTVWLSGGKQEQASLLMQLPQQQGINDIRITHKGEQRHFQRQGETWRMLEPLDIAANEVQIEKMLNLRMARSEKHFSVEADEMDKFGFTAQALEVELDGHRLRFGTTDPLQGRRYVAYQGQIHIIDRDLHYLFNMPLGKYISPRLLPVDSRLTAVHTPEAEVILEQGNWVAKGEGEAPSADQIAAYLDEWRYASAMEVGLYQGNGGEKIRVVTEQGEYVFDLHRDDTEIRLGRADLKIQYHLPTDVVKRLLHP